MFQIGRKPELNGAVEKKREDAARNGAVFSERTRFLERNHAVTVNIAAGVTGEIRIRPSRSAVLFSALYFSEIFDISTASHSSVNYFGVTIARSEYYNSVRVYPP